MNWPLIFGLIIALMAVLGVVIVIVRHQARVAYLTAEDRALIHVRWHEVEQHLKKGGPTHFRQAIIEADKLVDYVLQQLGVSGESMGERLRQAQPRFTDYQGIWDAHKTRNQVVHEMNKDVLSFETKSALKKFHAALKDLGAL